MGQASSLVVEVVVGVCCQSSLALVVEAAEVEAAEVEGVVGHPSVQRVRLCCTHPSLLIL